jgi:hypothetical protein
MGTSGILRVLEVGLMSILANCGECTDRHEQTSRLDLRSSQLDDEDSSLRRMNTRGSVYRFWRSLLPPSSVWSLGLKASHPRKTSPKVS